jgi:RND family efflux transporter MFP subunit
MKQYFFSTSILFFGLNIAASPHAAAAEFDCIIEPRQVLEIRSPLEGLIETMDVDRGDIVKKGQILARLDTSVDRAQAAIAKHRAEMEGAVRSGQSRVEFTARKSARSEDLHGRNFVSAEARDQAVTERLLAESELRDARDNRRLAELDYARQMEIIRLKTILSPVNGVVTERILNPGEFAEAGVGRKPIIKLAEIDTLFVEVLLPADAFGKVTRGMVVEVVPEIPADTRHRATLKVIDRVLDAASGTFGVRLELPNPRHQIPAGIRCKVNFPRIDAKPGVKIAPRSDAKASARKGAGN